MALTVERGKLTFDNLETAGRDYCATIKPAPVPDDRQAPWGGSLDCPPSLRYLPNLDGYAW